MGRLVRTRGFSAPLLARQPLVNSGRALRPPHEAARSQSRAEGNASGGRSQGASSSRDGHSRFQVGLPIQKHGGLLRGILGHGRSTPVGGPRLQFEQARSFSAEADGEDQREVLEYDVVIVGGGPAGLGAAIRLKQLCQENGRELSVCVVEKAPEVGAHILSGNVFETRALSELFPDWKDQDAPMGVPVTDDKFWFLSEKRAVPLPSPFNNQGNYVLSLSQLVRWLAAKAEELGVEVYPGFAASEVLYETNRVVGIATNDMGIAKDGSKKSNFQRGMELKGRLTLFGEGCRGSLSETIIKKYQLREQAQAQHQTYALGIKEVWEVEESKHRPGYVLHTVGWPLDYKTYGGSFLYHMDNRQVAIGLVVALDYKNPYLSPYEEYQRFKQHPSIRPTLDGGKVIQYGARTLNEGGFQSIPKTVFPGGALLGDSAGFLNVPKIKGSHTALKSGMVAAEAAFGTLGESEQPSMEAYWTALQQSWVWQELRSVRNIRPAFQYGLLPGLAHAGLDHYLMKGKIPFTLRHGPPDHKATEPASKHKPIPYAKPDGVVSFDLLTSLYRSSTNHEHDQPPHLRLRDLQVPESVNLPQFAGPESRYCPARVYEYVADENDKMKLSINAQNCLHCKACDIKDPTQNIHWTVPEGGGGPGYTVMDFWKCNAFTPHWFTKYLSKTADSTPVLKRRESPKQVKNVKFYHYPCSATSCNEIIRGYRKEAKQEKRK